MVLHLLKDSSKDETGVQWKWWDQHNRKTHWYQALTQARVSIQKPVLQEHLFHQTIQSNVFAENFFVLWIHSIGWEGYECMMSEVEFARLNRTWREWSHFGQPVNVSERCLPS